MVSESESPSAPESDGHPVETATSEEAARELTAKQETAIAALAGAPTYGAAAKAAGVTDRTLRRWMSGDAIFRQRLRAARASAFESSIGVVSAASTEAAGILETIARDTNASHGARVAAARALLHYSCRGREIAEMDDRMDAIEEKITEMSAFLNDKSDWRER